MGLVVASAALMACATISRPKNDLRSLSFLSSRASVSNESARPAISIWVFIAGSGTRVFSSASFGSGEAASLLTNREEGLRGGEVEKCRKVLRVNPHSIGAHQVEIEREKCTNIAPFARQTSVVAPRAPTIRSPSSRASARATAGASPATSAGRFPAFTSDKSESRTEACRSGHEFLDRNPRQHACDCL